MKALQSATREQLIQYIDSQAAQIRTLQATVDIDTSVGGSQRGRITEYKEIRGYVLARKPAMLRMIGLMPIVRNKAFDMVSDGQKFQLWIPPKNRFVEGHNNVVHPSAQPLENLRPQTIYDALLLHSIDGEKEIAIVETNYEVITDAKGNRVEQPDYQVDVIDKGNEGWFLARKIIFRRTDLLPHRQLIYDQRGNLATDGRYEDFNQFQGINFPYRINIWRPQEEYSILLKVVKLQLNQPLSDEQFTLERPPGAQVVNLDQQVAPRPPSESQP